MYAVFETGGKQYRVTLEDIVYVEKLDVEAGQEVVFENVLLVDDKIGNPYVKGAKVIASVEKHGKNKKIIVFKYKAKKNYRKKQGHRQPYTKLKIVKIEG